MSSVSAAARGWWLCHDCELLCRVGNGHHATCPRCGAALHARRPDSITRCWALIIAATVTYIPANVLPIMITTSIFGEQADTILSGVAYLWHHGSWPLAVIVFTASVAVPLLKLLALSILVFSIQRRTRWDPLQRTKLYRLVELVGKWSMLDIFVVAVMAALVQLKALAVIQAGPGAIAFGAVVVLTMFAAQSFDPRLIWDTWENENDR